MVGVLGITSSPAPLPQKAAQAKEVEVSSPEPVGGSFTTSRIRVDNLLDVAILEVRESDTGEVIKQFPTEKQISAFAKAESLLVQKSETRRQERIDVASDITVKTEATPSRSEVKVETTNSQPATPAPAPKAEVTVNTAPAPSTAAPQTQTAEVSTES